jgi:hypothetical protein
MLCAWQEDESRGFEQFLSFGALPSTIIRGHDFHRLNKLHFLP